MRDRSHFLWMILPILPLLAGFAALHLVNDGTMTLLSDQADTTTFHPGARDLRFFNALVPYVALGLFHVAGCTVVTVVALRRILSLPPVPRLRGLQVLGVSFAVLVLVNILARTPALIGALRISYRTTCDLLLKAWPLPEAEGAPHILPSACDAAGLSVLAWLAIMPYVAGLTAAVAASALASTAFAAPRGAPDADVVDGTARIERAFQATTFVLVTSTMLMVLFYRLPLPLIQDENFLALVTTFGNGMGMFWGVMFTLTLMAIFGPALLLMPGRLPATEEGAALRDRLFGTGARKRLAEILLLLAPLLIGSAGTLLEVLAKAI